jgi:hypothetical protein
MGLKKLYLIPLILFLIWIGYVVGSQMIMRTVPSSGVMAYGDIEVYSDPSGTINVTSIDWGTCYISETVTRSAYIRNEGTVSITLLYNTSDWEVIVNDGSSWIPSQTAESRFEFSTNFNGTVLAPDQIIPVEFYLRPLPDARNYDAFKFNINLIGDDGR